MKTLLTALLLATTTGLSTAAAPAIGSVSSNRNFAVANNAGVLSNMDTNDYEGKILIIMFMTPWCPTCQSNAQAVGAGLTSFFADGSRGALKDKNDRGVPIQTLLLSTEEAAQWDSVNQSFASTNSYQKWGIDAEANRTNPRLSLGYFRGGFIEDTDLHAWGNDRRRLVVLNLVRDSASHSYREIVLNQNSYSSSDNTAARAAINAIKSAPIIVAPAITNHPDPVTVTSGATTRLAAAASGTSPTYQWFIGNAGNTNNPISGATSASYTTPALTSSTRYWVRASNTAGNANSSAALVTVTPPPVINNFSTWQAARNFPVGQSGPQADPDFDGLANLLEFFHGTDPLVAGTGDPLVRIVRDSSGIRLIYQQAADLAGIAATYQSSVNLTNWFMIPTAGLTTTTRVTGATREITAYMPANSNPATFYQLKVVAD